MQRYLLEQKNVFKTVAVSIALAAAFSILITCFVVREMVTQHDEELTKVIASEVYDDIGNEMLKAVTISRGMANDAFLHRFLKTESNYTIEGYTDIMTEWLSSIKERLNYSSAFLASEGSRNYWMSNTFVKRLDLENDPHDKWYKDMLDSGEEYMLNVDTNEAEQMTLGVFVNHKIVDSDGKFWGVCGVGVDMINLQKIIALDEKKHDVKINLVNKSGIVQVDTEAHNIENMNLTDMIAAQRSNQFFLNKADGKYIVTKYLPELDWYLVVQREGDKVRSVFLNVILYMSLGFMIAAAALLRFVQSNLNKSKQNVKELAKNHGLASHAGLYVSMHLIDLKNDVIHELSRDPNVHMLSVDDGREAKRQIRRAVDEMTDKKSLPAMIDFVNFDTLNERMSDVPAIHQEFLSEEYGWCRAHFMVVDQDKDGALSQIVFAIELIDEEKRREKHLLYTSETDKMTGLRNRGSGERAVSDLMQSGIEGMFFIFNADEFKLINDNFGHDTGDKVIKAIADCLKKAFRNDDIIMRVGGDEFAAYAIGITDEAHGQIITDRLFNMIGKINIPELGDHTLTVSLGAAFFKVSDDCSFDELYRRANAATGVSKKATGNCCTFHKQ